MIIRIIDIEGFVEESDLIRTDTEIQGIPILDS